MTSATRVHLIAELRDLLTQIKVVLLYPEYEYSVTRPNCTAELNGIDKLEADVERCMELLGKIEVAA